MTTFSKDAHGRGSYKTRFRFGDYALVRMDDALIGYVVRYGQADADALGEINQGYPTYKAIRYSDGEIRWFDSEHDWDKSKAIGFVARTFGNEA